MELHHYLAIAPNGVAHGVWSETEESAITEALPHLRADGGLYRLICLPTSFGRAKNRSPALVSRRAVE